MPTQTTRRPPRTRKSRSESATLRAAAIRWGVPYRILVGVYGVESSFGANMGPSSAGALGPFQFIASTGAAYGIPGNQRLNFTKSADAAAHYLHDLKQQTGSWDAALQSYSGGGYGLNTVLAKAKDAPQLAGVIPGPIDPSDLLPGPDVPDPSDLLPGGGGLDDLLSLPGEIIDAFKAMFAFLQMILDPHFWVRVLEVIAGLILIHMGLKNLSGTYGRGQRAAGRKRGVVVGAARQVGKKTQIGAAINTAAKVAT